MKRENYKKLNVSILLKVALIISFVIMLFLNIVQDSEDIVIKDEKSVGVAYSPADVHMYPNGGTIDSSFEYHDYYEGVYVLFLQIGDSVTFPTSSNIHRKGYVFDGWYTNEECVGTPITGIDRLKTFQNIVYAKWINKKDAMVLEKKASWCEVDGKKCDDNGNPYVKISIKIDCSSMPYEWYEGCRITIDDYIPSEFTVLEETILEDFNTNDDYVEYDKTNNKVTAHWDNDAAFQGTASCYECSFIMTLDLKKVDINKLRENGVIYTNGNSIYEKSEESAKIDISILEHEECLSSAELDIEGLEERLPVNVYMYCNGGNMYTHLYDFTEEKDDHYIKTVSKEGTLILPTSSQVLRDGYSFKGWYTNSDFRGTPITEISDLNSDVKLYAKWRNLVEDFVAKKTAAWYELDGKKCDSKGNPYIKVDITFDCSRIVEDVSHIAISFDCYIPAEYTVLEDTMMLAEDIECGSKNIRYDKENECISVSWDNIQRRPGIPTIYECSFIMILDLAKVDNEKVRETGIIYTNGKSMYQKDKKSVVVHTAMFDEAIYIPSAQLDYTSLIESEEGKSDTKEIYTATGLNFSKTASWCEYKGSTTDSNDNPYVKIEFRMDPTKYCDLNGYSLYPQVQSDTVVKDREEGKLNIQAWVLRTYIMDIVPKEFTIIKDSVECNSEDIKTEIIQFDDYTMLEAEIFNGLKRMEYVCSFVMVLDKSKLSQEYITGEKRINTNGETINSSVDSMGSSAFYHLTSNIELESPSLSYKVFNTEENVTDLGNVSKDDTKKDDVEGYDNTPATNDMLDYKRWLWVMMIVGMGMVILNKKYKYFIQ